MARFEYEARNRAGALVHGILEAPTEREVLSHLAQQGLYTVAVREAKGRVQRRSGRIRARHVAWFFGALSDLLRAGVPLLSSLEILEGQTTNAQLATLIEQLRADVAEGVSLAEAMARHPAVFGELTVSMVRAGQEGAFLEEVLRRIADFMEHQEEMKARVLGALAYPAFLLCVTTVVLIVMLTFFVPRFELIFSRMRERGQLPWLTEALLTTSSTIQEHWLTLGTIGGLAGAVLYGLLRSAEGRAAWDRWKLRIPVLGRIWSGWAVARFCRILGTLLTNGVPILTALRIARDSTGNHVMAAAIDRAAESVASGAPLSAPLRAAGVFPADVVEMISVGEESNNLEQVLIRVAETTERRLTRQVELLVRMLEPVLLLVMAGITLVVVAALLLPVLRMGTAL
jgi:general secretion pathway protein F